MEISYFTTLQAGWLNAWIPSFGMMLIEYIYVKIFKDGGKRALDSSWRNRKDKINYMTCSILQLSLLILSIFVPLKMDMGWLIPGALIYFLSLAGFIWSIHSYAAAPADQVICNGIYRWSRNPDVRLLFCQRPRHLCCFSIIMDVHRPHCSDSSDPPFHFR